MIQAVLHRTYIDDLFFIKDKLTFQLTVLSCGVFISGSAYKSCHSPEEAARIVGETPIFVIKMRSPNPLLYYVMFMKII